MNSEFPAPGAIAPESGSHGRQALRIALGIHHLSPRGGLEDNCIRIAEELDRRGHDVSLFVAGPFPPLPLKTVSLTPPVQPLFNHWRAARFAKAFIAATRGAFDRTVAFQPAPGADILFTADWIRDRPDVSPWHRLMPRFRTYAALEKGCFAADSSTRIIGLSEPQIRAYIDRYGTRGDSIAILPPTVPPERRKPAHRTEAVRSSVRSSFGIGPNTPLWLWIGLQPAVKGLDRVLAALERHPDAHLLVCGAPLSGRKVAAYQADARKRGVGERVHWLGFVVGLHDYMAAADVLSHPARLDVTGGVILEAIVNGLPVVATSICGFAGHIRKSGAGKVIAEPFDPESFQAALAEVCGPNNATYSANGIAYGSSPDLYMGTAVACDLIEAEAWPVRHLAPRVADGFAAVAAAPLTAD